MSAPYSVLALPIPLQPPSEIDRERAIFEQATLLVEAVRAETVRCSAILHAFPVNVIGTVPESVQAGEDYQIACRNFTDACEREQRVYDWYSRRFLATDKIATPVLRQPAGTVI